ncbi:MAG: hypothetical protein ACTSXZ_04320 [Alphaproteobacteria bacterium]
MIWYLIMLAVGLAGLIVLALFHQWLVPLERGMIRPEWKPHRHEVPEGPDRVEVAGTDVICHCRDGSQLHFKASGMHLALGALAFVTVNDQRLLAVLDRGRLHRTYLVDIRQAADGGSLLDGVVGWWRHGTGRLLAADGEHLVEVHHCLGRDRIYLLDPARAAKGYAFGLGIERTLIAPIRNLGSVDLIGLDLHVSAGQRRWRTELF